MKENFKGISLADLCSWFGVSRQAYYQSKNGVEQDLIEQEILLEKINDIRKDHKRLGGRKLFFKLEDFMTEHHIKMGRDAFFASPGTCHQSLSCEINYPNGVCVKLSGLSGPEVLEPLLALMRG